MGRGVQQSIAFEHTAWSAGKSAACCNVWWGQLARDCGVADYSLTVVTALAQPSSGASAVVGGYPQSAIHRYSCAKQHTVCSCKVGEAAHAVRIDAAMDTHVKTTVAAPVADCSDCDEQDCIQEDLKCEAGHPVSNCHSLGL